MTLKYKAAYRWCVCSEIRRSQVFLEVPHFATSVYMSTKHFDFSYAHDVPKIWNDLPDDVCSATSFHSSRKKLKTYLFAQAYPP